MSWATICNSVASVGCFPKSGGDNRQGALTILCTLDRQGVWQNAQPENGAEWRLTAGTLLFLAAACGCVGTKIEKELMDGIQGGQRLRDF